MLINKGNLEQIFINLKTTFHKAFDAAPSAWAEIAMEVPSTGKENDYSWLSNFPKMREWIGDKVVKSLEAYQYVIRNKRFEATVEVQRDDVEDDALGIYLPQAQGAGESAKQWPDELIADACNGAFVNPCYDGQYYIDTDHPVGDGNGGVASVSNRLTVALSAATQAAAIASLGAAETMMMKFKDDEGRPLNVVPNILMVPPALASVANILYANDQLNDGQPNPYKGKYKVRVDPRLTSDTAWFLLCTTKAVKPFVYQPRKKPVFVSQTDMSSDDVFMRGKWKFGAEARGNAGYGFWQLCVGSTGAG